MTYRVTRRNVEINETEIALETTDLAHAVRCVQANREDGDGQHEFRIEKEDGTLVRRSEALRAVA